MKLRTSYPRASISLALAMAIATVFTLRSFAAPEAIKLTGDARVAQDCTGTLTVKSGQVTINGNAAQTGATILSGSVVTTGAKSSAVVSLGKLGRVEVGGDTTITLRCGPDSIEISSTCPKTEIKVRRGTVDVKAPKTEALIAGKEETYDGPIELRSSGEIDLKIECKGRKVGAGPFIGPGLLGLLALIGVGAGVAIGVAVGGDDNVQPSSPIR
jgi:phage baseplate assembly protein gpV